MLPHAHTILLAAGATVSAGGWDFISYNLPQAGVFNWSGVTQLAYTALDATAVYHLGPVRLEANPALDLVIMGGDGSSDGAGRFYGDGLAATRESHGTYFTQADLPQDRPGRAGTTGGRAPPSHRLGLPRPVGAPGVVCREARTARCGARRH